jgi:hypothetical protein
LGHSVIDHGAEIFQSVAYLEGERQRDCGEEVTRTAKWLPYVRFGS